jgi:uncharacterized membrane protein YfcA
MILAGYLAMAVVGMTLGLIGAGGSILTVPILVYFFKQTAADATAHSMGIVGVTAVVALMSYWRRGLVDVQAAAKFVPASLIGVYVARLFILPLIPQTIVISDGFRLTKDQLILGSFAVVMLFAARSMIRPIPVSSLVTASGGRGMSLSKSLAIALTVGVVTGFVGAGGGFLIIPALVNLVGMQMSQAVGTSLLIIAINTLGGFLAGLTDNAPNWALLISLSIVASFFAVVSGRFAQKVPQDRLKLAFGWFVICVGSWLLWQQFAAALP